MGFPVASGVGAGSGFGSGLGGFGSGSVGYAVLAADEAGLPGMESWDVLQPRQFRNSMEADWRRSRSLGITDVLRTIFNDDWTEKILRQAQDDTEKPWGHSQSLAIFGTPESDDLQCAITGFHLTARATSGKGHSPAFGGPITHGHQPSGFHEKVGHPGNFFWHQALRANEVFQALDARQRKTALVTSGMPYYTFDGKIDRRVLLPESPPGGKPRENDIRFHGADAKIPGLPISEMTGDQKSTVEHLVSSLIEPYRDEYQQQVLACLKKQGGLGKCSLAFYREHDLGDDGQWDNWRLEGPSLVWYFRGYPHVHIWIHVADDPSASVSSHFG